MDSELDSRRQARRHRNDEPEDHRARFQRDRDRVLYCSAFRRLAGVTQVVHTDENSFHNRLTHSLKVAQVGRRLAEQLVDMTDSHFLEEAGGLNPDVVETAALCHDIGHPPFGHAAEDELKACFKSIGVPDGFEGNAQSFRIVTKAACREPDHPGLDLTAASLCAVLKYPWGRADDEDSYRSQKFGYFKSEEDDFRHARSFLRDDLRSLEAEIMNWADDVAYAVHDIEDAFRAGLVPLHRLLKDDIEKERYLTWIVDRWVKQEAKKGGNRHDCERRQIEAESRKHEEREIYARFLDGLRGSPYRVMREPFRGTHEQRAGLNRAASWLLSRFLEVGPDAVLLDGSPERPRLVVNEVLRAEVDTLKSMMIYYVYDNSALVAQQIGHRTIVRELFETIYKAIKPQRYGILPLAFRERAEQIYGDYEGPSLDRERARLVTDVIVSMTERQASQMHARLFGRTPGTVRDSIL